MVLSYGAFLPLDLTSPMSGDEHWLKQRTIPKNRAYVDAMLSKTRLSINRPAGPAGQKRQCVRHPGLSRHTYADSLLPVAYDSFLEEAATVMQPRHHRMMRKLLDFRFDHHTLPANRLTVIEQEVRRRASWLLQ